jgi:putative aminopeptidase FrvX
MAYESLFERLAALANTYGVSGNEGAVAAEVRGQLAAAGIAEERWESDRLGSQWLRFGPAGEPERLLIAHLDEIGLRISGIRADGLCRVVPIGGIDAQLWEGTAVLVHVADGQLVPGCIAPVSLHVTHRQGLGPKTRLEAHELLLDVAAGSAQEVAAMGIRLLDSVTWPKRLQRMGPEGAISQGRSLDDRFGCTALIECAIALEAAAPPVPTVLAWVVQEEVGLRGAAALAQRFAQCREVIAVDSFTVANSPRDNPQFYAGGLGDGAALRCHDATTLMPDSTRRAWLDKAAGLGFPKLQYGYMAGGNDASVFETSGASVIGLGVPLAYSHSAVEQIHLGDLQQLCELLAVWCGTNTEV